MRLRVILTVLGVSLALVAIPLSGQAGVKTSGVKCVSGNYKGKTAKGHSVSFKVDCTKKVVGSIKVSFKVRCLDGTDAHFETGTATGNFNIPIKKRTYPNVDNPGGPRGVDYFNKRSKAASLVANRTAQNGSLHLRGTTPPADTVEGTMQVDFSYGDNPPSPDYRYSCAGGDGVGPAKFTATRG